MLVLTRKRGEQIVIDGRIVVTLLDTRDGRARLGIKAPQEIPVHREEVHQAITESRERLAMEEVEEGNEVEEVDSIGLEEVRRAIAAANFSSPYPLAGSLGAGSDRRDVIEIGIAYGTEKRHWLQWAVEEFAARDEGQKILFALMPMGSMEAAHAILDGDQRIHV